ncbi:MAG: hypothetical protein AAF990_15070 [Bacteroidota bacterium]
MLRSILMLLLLLPSWIGTAQIVDSSEQTLAYTEETGSFEEQQFVDAYDYLFRTKEPAKSLFKLDLVNSLPVTTIIGQYNNTSIDLQATFGLTYERKLSNVFSINASVIPFYSNTIIVDYTIQSVFSNFSLGLYLEPRWYYDMRKRILSSRSANNLSGNYLGLRVGGNWLSANLPDDSNTLTLSNLSGQLQIGQQRRIFKRGFFDISASMGTIRKRIYRDELLQEYDHKWEFLYGLQIGMGLAIGGEIYKAPDAIHCDAFRCFLEEKTMFKIGLLQLFEGNSSNGFEGKIILEYEHKLGLSTWSLAYGARLDYFLATRINNNEENKIRTGYGITFGPRWYYNLKERIAKGKTANNLSSNYFTIHTIFNSSPGTIQNRDNLVRYRDQQLAFIPAWGIQRRFFKHGYFDYKLGFGPTTDGRSLPREQGQPVQGFLNRDLFDKVYFQFLSELKVGLAF